MKLYKKMSEQCAREYLHTGRVAVFPINDRCGGIVFSSMRQFERVPKAGVMLEFEAPSAIELIRKNCFRESDKVLRIELTGCEQDDSKCLYKVDGEFKLEAVILSDCKMEWPFVRSCLKGLGKEDVAIKCLQVYGDCSHVDEEYCVNGGDLCRLKWNRNNPKERDRIQVVDVK